MSFRTVLSSAAAISLLFVSPALAVAPLEMDNAVVLESSDPAVLDQLVVTGHNFNNGGEVALTLGGTPLTVILQEETRIIAEIPAQILPGSYVLVAWTGNGSVREDSMDITIGAEGPQGPPGQDGAPGADGQDGAPGADGQDGAPGDDGSSCSASDTTGGALIQCTNGTSAMVSDGANGINGFDGQDGTSCSVTRDGGVATIDCGEGGTETIADGAPGPQGEHGPQGPEGPRGPAGTAIDEESRDAVCTLYIQMGLNRPTFCFAYVRGEIGPAGGIVFLVDPDGWGGYEASPTDLTPAAWGCPGAEIVGADSISIGASNTADIVSGCADASIAAKQADDYVHNGYDDWFLPSVGELIKLWENGGGLEFVPYWSSSEVDATTAHAIVHSTRSRLDKAEVHNVRAIRRFEVPRE